MRLCGSTALAELVVRNTNRQDKNDVKLVFKFIVRASSTDYTDVINNLRNLWITIDRGVQELKRFLISSHV